MSITSIKRSGILHLDTNMYTLHDTCLLTIDTGDCVTLQVQAYVQSLVSRRKN